MIDDTVSCFIMIILVHSICVQKKYRVNDPFSLLVYPSLKGICMMRCYAWTFVQALSLHSENVALWFVEKDISILFIRALNFDPLFIIFCAEGGKWSILIRSPKKSIVSIFTIKDVTK